MKATVPVIVLAVLCTACSTTRTPPDAGHPSSPLVAASAPGAAPAMSGAPAAVAPAAQDQVDPELIKQGYRAGHHNGQVVYCKEQGSTGSRFTSDVCLTADQLKEQQRRAREEMQRIRQNGCGATSGCGS
jgi:invasion protein IalB